MKYAIELTNKQKAQMDCMMEIVHRYVGFNPKLEPMRDVMTIDEKMLHDSYMKGQAEGYARGKEDGYKHQQEEWENELAKHKQEGYDNGYTQGIADYRKFIRVFESGADIFEDIRNTDGTISTDMILQYLPMCEIMARIKAYEEKKQAEKEIKVGDIVKFNEKCHEYERVKDRQYLVLHIDYDKGHANLLHDSGDTSCADVSLLKKTGKHVNKAEGLVRELFEE